MLSLLVTFVLHCANGVASAWDETPVFGCEPEVKSVCMDAGDDNNPVSDTRTHGKCPTLHGDGRIPAVDLVFLRNKADPITFIRGPPAGNQAPA